MTQFELFQMICLLGVTMEELRRAEDGIRVYGIGRDLFTVAPKNVSKIFYLVSNECV